MIETRTRKGSTSMQNTKRPRIVVIVQQILKKRKQKEEKEGKTTHVSSLVIARHKRAPTHRIASRRNTTLPRAFSPARGREKTREKKQKKDRVTAIDVLPIYYIYWRVLPRDLGAFYRLDINGIFNNILETIEILWMLSLFEIRSICKMNIYESKERSM